MILLDSHAWLWWSVKSPFLSSTARNAIKVASAVGLSPLSVYEITYAHWRGRVGLGLALDDWLAASIGAGITMLPITPSISAQAGSLEWTHGDPADRILVATAKHHGIPMVTGDQRIRESGLVEVVW